METSINLKYGLNIFLILIFLLSACTQIPREVGSSAPVVYESKNFIAIHENIRYHCYQEKGYCYEDGNIDKPRVPLIEVIG